MRREGKRKMLVEETGKFIWLSRQTRQKHMLNRSLSHSRNEICLKMHLFDRYEFCVFCNPKSVRFDFTRTAQRNRCISPRNIFHELICNVF